MKTLSSLKKDLEFNQGLSALLEALKTIAVAQYRGQEQRLRYFEKLLSSIDKFLEFIDPAGLNHPFTSHPEKPALIVAITSDSGLLGGLNMQVINAALAELGKKPGKLVVVGERGKAYVRESGVPFVAFSGIIEEERHTQAIQLKDYLVERILGGDFGNLKIVYPHPVSFTVQHVRVVNCIPYIPETEAKTSPGHASEVIFESLPEDIVEYAVGVWLGQKIYELFGLSRLAEFAARYVHLEESNQKLKEMDRKTRLEYFRVRHELIDRNMRELFSARLLYVGS